MAAEGTSPGPTIPPGAGLDVSQLEQLTVPELQRTKERLLDNLANLKAVLGAEQLPLPDDDEEKLRERIQELQTELFSRVTDLSKRESMLKRLQLGRTVLEILYPSDGVSREADEAERQEMKALVVKQCQQVSSILTDYKELNEMKPKLEAILTKKFEYATENRKLMDSLKEKQDSKSTLSKTYSQNPQVKETTERMQKKIWRYELGRNTLQGLILGSGVNWAEDEELTEMLLKLGTALKP